MSDLEVSTTVDNFLATGNLGDPVPGTAALTSLVVGGSTTLALLSGASGGTGSDNVNAGEYHEVSVPLPGAMAGDHVSVSFAGPLTDGIVYAFAYATTDEVKVGFFNADSLAHNLPEISMYVTLHRFS